MIPVVSLLVTNIIFCFFYCSFAKSVDQTTHARFPYEESLLTGFQMAVQNGPLSAEPVEGLLCVIESASTVGQGDNVVVADSKVSGQLISQTREQIYRAFLEWSPRMLLATYNCDIQATTEVLGKVYSVITRRRGKILSEEMREGTPFFIIHASIPVVEAFGFSEEIRKKTSGAANPQLVFSGFEVLDEDPFWVPTTEEELEELGELADRENVAKLYMESVRRRKGLAVHEKVVANAEKQRTMKK